MKQSRQASRVLRQPTLLSLARGSVGSKAFSHLYVRQGARKADVVQSGDLACAFFVSHLLTGLGLLDRIHGTVEGTERAMRESGWRKRRDRRPRAGDILVWEAKRFPNGSHKHIGFFVGRRQAVSTSSRRRTVALHDYRYADSRRIEAVYWNPKLNA
jgi:hypothetical protein